MRYIDAVRKWVLFVLWGNHLMTTYRIAVHFKRYYLVNVAAPSAAVALEWIALDWQANKGNGWDHVRIDDPQPTFEVEGQHGVPCS
jgi:hypothetical protein